MSKRTLSLQNIENSRRVKIKILNNNESILINNIPIDILGLIVENMLPLNRLALQLSSKFFYNLLSSCWAESPIILDNWKEFINSNIKNLADLELLVKITITWNSYSRSKQYFFNNFGDILDNMESQIVEKFYIFIICGYICIRYNELYLFEFFTFQNLDYLVFTPFTYLGLIEEPIFSFYIWFMIKTAVIYNNNNVIEYLLPTLKDKPQNIGTSNNLFSITIARFINYFELSPHYLAIQHGKDLKMLRLLSKLSVPCYVTFSEIMKFTIKQNNMTVFKELLDMRNENAKEFSSGYFKKRHLCRPLKQIVKHGTENAITCFFEWLETTLGQDYFSLKFPDKYLTKCIQLAEKHNKGELIPYIQFPFGKKEICVECEVEKTCMYFYRCCDCNGPTCRDCRGNSSVFGLQTCFYTESWIYEFMLENQIWKDYLQRQKETPSVARPCSNCFESESRKIMHIYQTKTCSTYFRKGSKLEI